MEYKEIPIEAAIEIAQRFDKDQVIIVTWDGVHNLTHVTTYGKDKDTSIQAAQGGNFVKAALGWPDELCHQIPEWWLKERQALIDMCNAVLDGEKTPSELSELVEAAQSNLKTP